MEEQVCDNVCIQDWRVLLGYYIAGITNIVVATIGLFVNFLGIYILQRGNEKHLFKKLLISLLAFDSCVLVTTIMSALYERLMIRSDILVYLFPYFSYPFFYIFVCCSTFMTIAISHERYQALKDPIIYRNTNESHSYQNRKLLKYLILAITVSCAYNIVRFFEHEVENIPSAFYENYLKDQKVIVNYWDNHVASDMEKGMVKPIVQKQEWYIMLYFRTVFAVADSVILGFIPLALLLYFNIRIFKIVKKERLVLGKTISVNQKSNGRSDIKSDEIRMAMVLFAIVGSFIFCYLFWLHHAILYAIWCIKCNLLERKTDEYCNVTDQSWYMVLDYGGRVLITLNSSINVLFYGFVQKKFRKDTKNTLSQRWQSLTMKVTSKQKNDKLNFSTTRSPRTPSTDDIKM